MNNNILALSNTFALVLGLLCVTAASAENVGTIQIKFEKVKTKGDNSSEIICPVFTTPKNGSGNANSYCKASANYESDLACLDKTGSSPTVTFKGTGPQVDYVILGEDQRFPTYMDCEPGNGRQVVCTLTQGGNFKYNIVTTGQAENCMLDPRVIITDRGPTPGDEKD